MSMPIGTGWSLAHLGLKYPALAAVCVATMSFMTFEDNETPMVIITFDDGYQSTLDVALPELQSRDLVATHYIPTGLLDTPGYIKSEDVIKFTDAGWEIGAHAINSVDLTTLSPMEMLYEIKTPIKILEELSNQKIYSFSSPLGEYDDNMIEEVDDYYHNHVNAWSDNEGMNYKETFDRYDIHRLDVSNKSVDGICNDINTLEADQKYSILFHDIIENAPNENRPYDTTYDDFISIIDCIHKAEQESDIRVVTMTRAAHEMDAK